jgi:hypothetical protein
MVRCSLPGHTGKVGPSLPASTVACSGLFSPAHMQLVHTCSKPQSSLWQGTWCLVCWRPSLTDHPLLLSSLLNPHPSVCAGQHRCCWPQEPVQPVRPRHCLI